MLFFRFDRGAPSPIRKDALTSLLAEFDLNLTERFENCSVIAGGAADAIGSELAVYFDGTEITEASISRPIYTDMFYDLATRLITDLGLCMVPSFGGEIYHPRGFDGDADLPEDFDADRISVSSSKDMKDHAEEPDTANKTLDTKT